MLFESRLKTHFRQTFGPSICDCPPASMKSLGFITYWCCIC